MSISQTSIYQTVEDRDNPDEIETFGPFKCKRNDAWLGHGYYFWDSFIELGHWWGNVSRKGNYVLTEAFYVNNEEKVWDLHGDGNHLKEFREILEEVIKKGIGTKDNVLVSQIIAFFLKKGTFKYKAIRALGKSKGNIFWDARFKHVVKFTRSSDEVLDMYPPVQICFIDKTALLLQEYRIVYPDSYIIDKYTLNIRIMESKMLDWFREYLNTTPLETIKTEWREIQEQFPVGVNAYEYLGFCQNYCYEPGYKNSPHSEIKAPNNMTPTFGVFFLSYNCI